MKQLDVAIAVISRDRKILICQRKADDTFGGFWEFPGGKREANESLEQCLARELREELDITVRILDPLTPIRHEYPNIHLTLYPFVCRHERGQPRLIECQKLQWIDPQRVGDYEFPPANESLLQEVRDYFKPRQT